MDELTGTRVFALLIAASVAGQFVPISIPVFGWSLTPVRLAIALLLIASFLSVRAQPRVGVTLPDVLILLLLILLVASIGWSVSPEDSLRRATDLLPFVGLYASLIVFFNRDQAFDTLMWALGLAAIAVAVYGLLAATLAPSFRNFVEPVSRNNFSRDAVALLPIVVATAYYSTGRRRDLFGITAMLLAVLVPISGSRSGTVGLLLAVALTYLAVSALEFDRSLARVTASVALLGGLAVIVLLGAIATGVAPERLTQIPLSTAGFSPEVLGQQRYLIRLAEFETVAGNWLTGIGYGAFPAVAESVYGLGPSRSHNLIIRVWLGVGIVGVVLLGAIGLLVIRNYSRGVANSDGPGRLYVAACFIGLAGITLGGMFNIVINEPMWYILLAVGSNYLPRTAAFRR